MSSTAETVRELRLLLRGMYARSVTSFRAAYGVPCPEHDCDIDAEIRSISASVEEALLGGCDLTTPTYCRRSRPHTKH